MVPPEEEVRRRGIASPGDTSRFHVSDMMDQLSLVNIDIVLVPRYRDLWLEEISLS